MSQNNQSNSNSESSEKDCGCNVGEVERVVSAVGGGILVYKGLSCGSVLGLLTAALGAGAIYRGATGTCSLYKALKINTNTEGQKLSKIAEQVKSVGVNVAEQAKTLATNAAEKTKSVSDDARNRISDAIAVR